MPWAATLWKLWHQTGNSSLLNGKMLTTVAHDQSIQLKMAQCWHWNLSAFLHHFDLFVLLYSKSLNDLFWGEYWILFENLNVSQTKSRETLRFLGNKIHCSPRNQSLSVNYNMLFIIAVSCSTLGSWAWIKMFVIHFRSSWARYFLIWLTNLITLKAFLRL